MNFLRDRQHDAGALGRDYLGIDGTHDHPHGCARPHRRRPRCGGRRHPRPAEGLPPGGDGRPRPLRRALGPAPPQRHRRTCARARSRQARTRRQGASRPRSRGARAAAPGAARRPAHEHRDRHRRRHRRARHGGAARRRGPRRHRARGARRTRRSRRLLGAAAASAGTPARAGT